MRKIITFDSRLPHIHMEFGITDLEGSRISVSGILDTGAPRTEFSDEFLLNAGLLKCKHQNIALKAGLQTQKYGEIFLPSAPILITQPNRQHSPAFQQRCQNGQFEALYN